MRNLKYIGICIVFIFGCSAFKDDGNKMRTSGASELSKFTSQIRPVKGNPESHYRLARYYQERDMHKKAIEELEKSVDIDPTYWRAYNAMGVSYDQLTNYSRAVESYEKALKLNPDSYAVLNNMGYSYMLQGNTALATSLLKKASEMKPDSIRIKNNLGLANAMPKPSAEKIAQGNVPGTEFKIDVLGTNAKIPSVNALTMSTLNSSPATSIPQKSETVKTLKGLQNSSLPPEKIAVQKQTTAIEISNGNGVRGMARNMRAYLKKDGYKVTRLTNAKKFNQPQTGIYYVGSNEKIARQIASRIPEVKQIRKIQRMDRPDIKVKLMLGKDLRNFRHKFSKEAI